jgi:hypothetical protein
LQHTVGTKTLDANAGCYNSFIDHRVCLRDGALGRTADIGGVKRKTVVVSIRGIEVQHWGSITKADVPCCQSQYEWAAIDHGQFDEAATELARATRIQRIHRPCWVM